MIDEAAAKATRAIQKARFQILTDKRMTFFGVVLMNLKPIAAQFVETAAVDGRHMFFNPAYINGLTPAQIKGVVCHEVGHVTGFHFERMGARDHERWNMATDAKINAGLRDIKIELPTGAFYGHPSHARMTCEEVYNALPKTGGGGKKGKSGDGKVSDPGKCGTMMAPSDENGKPLSASEARAVQHAQRAVVEEASRMAKAQGSMPQFVERLIHEANNEPLPWQDILRKFVSMNIKRDYTWRRPNRRMMGQGVYLPSQKTEGLSEVVIGVDTSGSISQEVLSQFIKETQSIMDDCEPEKIHVVVCDAHVHYTETFNRGDQINIRMAGGGGTDFRPVFDWVKEQSITPLCLIYLTDLTGSFPTDPGYPTVWATTHPGSPPFGEVVHLKMDK